MKLLTSSSKAKAKKTPTPVPPPTPAPSTPIGAGLGLFEETNGDNSSSLRRVIPAQSARAQTPLLERLGSLFGTDHVPLSDHGQKQPPVLKATATVAPTTATPPLAEATATVTAVPTTTTTVLQGWVVPNPEPVKQQGWVVPNPVPVQAPAPTPPPVLPWEVAQITKLKEEVLKQAARGSLPKVEVNTLST